MNPLDLPLHIVLAGWLLRRLLPYKPPERPVQAFTLLLDDLYASETMALANIYQRRSRQSKNILKNILVKFLNFVIERRQKQLGETMTKLWFNQITTVVVVPFKKEE